MTNHNQKRLFRGISRLVYTSFGMLRRGPFISCRMRHSRILLTKILDICVIDIDFDISFIETLDSVHNKIRIHYFCEQICMKFMHETPI